MNLQVREFRLLHLADHDQPEREVEIYPNPITEGRITITASERYFFSADPEYYR